MESVVVEAAGISLGNVRLGRLRTAFFSSSDLLFGVSSSGVGEEGFDEGGLLDSWEVVEQETTLLSSEVSCTG